jgi:hypothetical protein
MSLAESSRTRLATVSTATLTTVLFKRGFRNTFIQGIRRLDAGGRSMVGPAYTLRYIPAREDLDHLGVLAKELELQVFRRGRLSTCPPEGREARHRRGQAKFQCRSARKGLHEFVHERHAVKLRTEAPHSFT